MRSQQFEQLPMFMTAREIVSEYHPNPGDKDLDWNSQGYPTRETSDKLWHRKEREAQTRAAVERRTPPTNEVATGRNARAVIRRNKARQAAWREGQHTTLATHILRNGVENPISLSPNSRTVVGGHHRVAVMLANKPDTLMPVEHFTDIVEAQRQLRDRY